MSNFDPAGSVVFDLNGGRVSLAQGGAQVMLPAAALAEVCARLDADSVRHFGGLLGAHAGARIQSRLGTQARPSMQSMVDQLGGELSLSGLGSLSIERWGQALVARVQGCPLGARAELLLSAYLERALLAALGRELQALPIETGPHGMRLFLCNNVASRRVQEWLSAGRSWGDALVMLHTGGAA
jgi:hypothetical protein